MFDNHIHSTFSGDSNLDPILACEIAIDRGLTGITFTDHLDFDFPGVNDKFFMVNFDLYIKFMNNLKKKYNGRLKILKGIEIGIQPHIIEESLEIANKYPFDYILASAHIIDKLDPYTAEYYHGRTLFQAYQAYLQEALYITKNFKNFNALGHFDYVIRNAVEADRSMKYSDFPDLFDEIFKALIDKGRGLEINTKSYVDRNESKTPIFDKTILLRYKELGGEIITFGSDSHEAGQIGYKFGYFKDLLIECGYKYLTHFENQKPVFVRI